MNPLLELHLTVLKELLNGKDFTEIKTLHAKEFEDLNYLETADGNLLSFNNGELIGAYPISPKKTKYKVIVEGVGTGYAMCAIDALGVAYTFMKKTKIESNYYDTNEVFVFEVDPNLGKQNDKDLFVTYKKFNDNIGNAALEQCPTINIFQSRDEVPANQNLEVLDFETALKYAKQRFSQDALFSCIQGTFDKDQMWEKAQSSDEFSSSCSCGNTENVL